jgi:hypothetical protein
MKTRTIIISITTLLILFIGFVCYSNTKVTTFEECVDSWLNREIVVYDYFVYAPGQIEQKCTLWTGKTFEIISK